jgi:hypothetical protein
MITETTPNYKTIAIPNLNNKKSLSCTGGDWVLKLAQEPVIDEVGKYFH